jgi:membrane-associated phospholipid phosphatase
MRQSQTNTLLGTAAAAAILAACSGDVVAPSTPACQLAANKSTDSVASVKWNEVTRAMVVKYKTDPSARPYAVVSVAQYLAALAAEKSSNSPCPSMRAATAAASAAALSYLYPGETDSLEARLQRQIAADEAKGLGGQASGVALGRSAAEPLIAFVKTDGLTAAWSGSVPTGPGMWFSSSKPPAPPATPMLGKMRPYFMTAGSQFRPAAPPAYGSAEFLAALAEVKTVAASRTADQLQSAQKWALSSGTYRTQGHWNVVASDLVSARGLREKEATHLLAVLNTAMNDASIACFDAKYTYWLIRPSQADTTIALAIGLPNHPSYPSSHSCTSGAASTVLGTLYPSEATRLAAMADEIGMSRLYAGIHYRFDISTGLEIGKSVGRLATQIDHDRGVESVVP